MLKDIKFVKYGMGKDEFYDIYFSDKIIGEFRIYYDIDFICCGVKLENFLGYIRIDSEYRHCGILRRVIDEFKIKSLMVDDIEDVSKDILFKIYSKLGFKLINGSKQFMIC